MSLTGAPESVSEKRRVWPVTAVLVIVALLLLLWQSYIGWITTAPFFGVSPSRDDYIQAAMTCLTTLPAFAAMIWCGWQRGSRRGLWAIGVPAAVMAVWGLSLLANSSAHTYPPPGPALADLFGRTTQINWFAFVVFAGIAVGTHLLRRRARHTEIGSAA